MHNVTIRAYRPAYVAQIVELVRETMGDEDASIAAANLASPSADELIYCGEADGVIVGTCGYWYDKHLPADVCGLYWFAVTRAWQRRGVGSLLLSNIEQAASLRYSLLFCEASPTALDYYLRRGYAETDAAHVPAEDRFPGTVLLTKKLK